jgi:hypothetical protein
VESTKELRARMSEDAKAFPTGDVLRMMKAFNEAAVDTRGGWQPSLSLELALAGAFETPEKPTDGAASHAVSGHGAPLSSGRAAQGGTSKAEAGKQPSSIGPEAGVSSQGLKPAISIDEVVRSWKDVRAAIKPAHPAVEALLNSCKPMDVRGEVLLLGFQSETVRGLMDKPENLELTRRAIADVLGVALGIQCVVTNAKGKLPPNVSQDGMVAAALNHGGKIVDMDE